MADLLYKEAGNLTLPDKKLDGKVKTEGLRPAVIAFLTNAWCIHAFWRLYPHLVEQASVNTTQLIETIFSLTGKPFLTKEQHEDPALKKKISEEVWRRINQRLEESGGSLEYATGYNFGRAVERFGALVETFPDMGEGVYATFSAQITSAWTTVETLATDLWEAALNQHPRSLARLGGTRQRISKLAGSLGRDRIETGERSEEEFEPKLRDFERITYGTYDASELMGTLLREQFKFQTLSGIRAAYSSAFSKRSEQIDAALADHSLDKLNLVRNVLLHKAGIVDDKFVKGADSLSWSILAEEEKPLPLTGQIVKELINPAFQCAEKLILAVDDWITAPSAEGE
jgi:hypothetical protein